MSVANRESALRDPLSRPPEGVELAPQAAGACSPPIRPCRPRPRPPVGLQPPCFRTRSRHPPAMLLCSEKKRARDRGVVKLWAASAVHDLSMPEHALAVLLQNKVLKTEGGEERGRAAIETCNCSACRCPKGGRPPPWPPPSGGCLAKAKNQNHRLDQLTFDARFQ